MYDIQKHHFGTLNFDTFYFGINIVPLLWK